MKNKSAFKKMFNTDNEHKVYCENCGHSVIFYNKKTERLICTHCGYWIYKDAKTKLKYKMKERGILNE